MNMGGGETYHALTTQTQDTSAQQNASNSNASEQQESENMIRDIGTSPNGLAGEEKVIKNAEDNIEQVEAVSIENSKPEDSTEKETTQQTVVQDPPITSQQAEAVSVEYSKPEDSTV